MGRPVEGWCAYIFCVFVVGCVGSVYIFVVLRGFVCFGLGVPCVGVWFVLWVVVVIFCGV